MESYINSFSKIGQLQEEEKIIYELIDNKNDQQPSYGVVITSQKRGQNCTFSHPNLSDSKHLVENLIKYLYENNVKAELSKDVIADILGMSTCLI
jgi:hypothetical protein